MKLTHLLAQYLYKTKKLDLQGIGSFLLDKSIHIETDKGKQNKETEIEGITFVNSRTTVEDPELIAFISTYSLKIKALASADLNSHLELAKQFMNIGKPFLFEGIGSLSKEKSGEYSFTPGIPLTEKLNENKTKESKTLTNTEEPVSDYKSALYKSTAKPGWRKPILFSLVVLGLALSIWAGYYMYKRNAVPKNNDSKIEEANKTILLGDSINIVNDSIPIQPAIISTNQNGSTKFVLEVSDKERAFGRFNMLKTFQWDVKMETSDSVSFKIFMLLPVSVMDTARVLDSLSVLSGKRVYIEK